MVNSLAGGGTLLTFPALEAALTSMGLPTAEARVIANATSTVALVPGSLASAWGYRVEIPAVRRWLVILIGPSLLGGLLGTLLVTRLPAEYFAELVPWLLLTAALVLLGDTVLGRYRKVRAAAGKPAAGAVAALVAAQFAVSIYGGYFGAGIGILMLSALALMGVGQMHAMNALKTVLAGCINGVSVLVFVMDGKVNWTFALPMALAAIVGGYLGARLALRVHPRQVRWAVIGIGFGLAIYYFLK